MYAKTTGRFAGTFNVIKVHPDAGKELQQADADSPIQLARREGSELRTITCSQGQATEY